MRAWMDHQVIPTLLLDRVLYLLQSVRCLHTIRREHIDSGEKIPAVMLVEREKSRGESKEPYEDMVD